MAHFYGTLQGNRGEATRMGTKNSGVDTVAASWRGCIRVYLTHNEETGEDEFRVEQGNWHGHGCYEIIAEGIVGQPAKTAKAS